MNTDPLPIYLSSAREMDHKYMNIPITPHPLIDPPEDTDRLMTLGDIQIAACHLAVTPSKLTFYHAGKECGCFDFGTDPITFVGNVDESAKAFVECVSRLMGHTITRYRASDRAGIAE